MERKTWSCRWNSARTARRSVRRRRETCRRMNCSSLGPPTEARRLSCWTTKRPSFPISFFRRQIDRLGLEAREEAEEKEWRQRTSAPPGPPPPTRRRREAGARIRVPASPSMARRLSKPEATRSIGWAFRRAKWVVPEKGPWGFEEIVGIGLHVLAWHAGVKIDISSANP